MKINKSTTKSASNPKRPKDLLRHFSGQDSIRHPKVFIKSTPNSKQRQNLSTKDASTFCSPEFGVTSKRPWVYIKTFGCQMNFRDSEIVAGLLLKRGYSLTDSIEEADVILFNTCSVRQHAEERVFGRLGKLRKLKAQSTKLEAQTQKPIIGIVGCMAESYKEKLLEKFPYIDLLVGPRNIHKLADKLDEMLKLNNKLHSLCLGLDTDPSEKYKMTDFRNKKVTAFVSIMEGCNNFCSYCIVPYVRGRETSRAMEDIIEEVNRLVNAGFKEVTLLGQNVNSYKLEAQSSKLKAGNSFVKLLEKVNETGIRRIRFITNHPKDTAKDLFKAMRDLSGVCECLHLPFQAGSDKILRAMNRNYTKKDYLKLIENLKKYIPDCGVSTDVIVGFPGETKVDFIDTVSLMKEAEFDQVFIFKYSPRSYTAASNLKDNVPQEVKQERNQILLELQKEVSYKKNKKFIGKEVEVLVEDVNPVRNSCKRQIRHLRCLVSNGVNKKSDEFSLLGRTRQNRIAMIRSQDKNLIGKLVKIKIREITPYALIGTAL